MSSPPLPEIAPLDALAGIYAQRISAALPLNWAQRISMHDCRGNVCWQSGGAWGPAERDAVRVALERFVGGASPARADHPLPEERTAVLLRAADAANVFRGFVMLVLHNRRLYGKGKSMQDLPVPVQRAAQEWATRMASAPTVFPGEKTEDAELSPVQAERLIAFGPNIDEPEVGAFFDRLRALPMALVAQPLTALQRGMHIRRYEVFLREASTPASAAATPGAPVPLQVLASMDGAPLSLLRDADDRGLGTVLDRRAAGALIVWLAARKTVFCDAPAQFSLNLSASSLSDPNFLRFVQLCVSKAGISPALLAFEVDQAMCLRNPAGLKRLGSAVETLGAGLIIDNCTLETRSAELLSLPAVRLAKIDRRLTQALAGSRIDQMRVAGLAQIARVGGVLTVAKQVEQTAEQELLRALGVDFIQGRASAPPVPLEELDQQRAAQQIIDEEALESQSA
jgi:EAL domain-containing protein (putative c-di-GMP-specific phosphodiesterase class I)